MASVVRVEGIKETVAELKKLEPGLIGEMRKEMRNISKPTISRVKANIPVISPLNGGLRRTGMMRPYGGMNTHAGRTRWDGVRVSTSFTPGKYAKGKDTHPLISIVATGRRGLGFDYAELAGVRRRPPRKTSKGWNSTSIGYHSYTVNGQGDAMIEKLNRSVPFRGKAGRFAFAVVLKERTQLEKDSLKVLTKYSDKVNQKLFEVGKR
jgi:hypothetical protein